MIILSMRVVITALLIMVACAVGAGIKLELRRCADAKEQNPALLAIVAFVSSVAIEFDVRSQLRQTEFRDARLLDSRKVFRTSAMPAGTLTTQTRDDARPVCVQPVFVLSPWKELLKHHDFKPDFDWEKIVRKDEWQKIAAESEKHKDILIAPTMTDSRTRSRELMHVLEWSRQTVPWADYIVNVNTNVHIHWPRMIELFPPPVPRASSGRTLWQLGSSDSSMDALFFKDPSAKNNVNMWRQCADVVVAGFSRDLVRQITGIPFATQIIYSLRHPLRIYRARCAVGKL